MSGNSNKIIAFNYYGAKITWLEMLYSHFPLEFEHIIDLFGGSFSVSLNYPGEPVRTANEISQKITNFFQVLRDTPEELIRQIELTPYSKAEYDNCREASADPVESARRFYVRHQQSFLSQGTQKNGWRIDRKKTCNRGRNVSLWRKSEERLFLVADIIRNNFQISNLDFREAIKRFDFDKAFFYCDPPYDKESRNSFDNYEFEFTEEDHIDLADTLKVIKGKAMVSGYNSELYDELYKGWNKVEFPTKKRNTGSSEVTEVIWMNYEVQRNDLFTSAAKNINERGEVKKKAAMGNA